MQISSFDDLLGAARLQPEPQRLLFVFAVSELPDGSSDAERARYEAGEGGALTPQVCADKTPDELTDFAALLRESQQFAPQWVIVFVAALSGRAGLAASSEDAAPVLERMVDAVRNGRLDGLIPFDRSGHAVDLR
jgi:hypothetical protein